MATMVSPEIKQVHFADNIDWEEENRRSAARFEKRRKDKESIRIATQQKELRMTGIAAVISNRSNWHDLSTLCFKDDMTKAFVWNLLLGRGTCDSTKLAKALVRFAKKDHTSLNSFNPNQIEALEYLNVTRKFCNEFRRQIAAATVITSGSEEESENIRRERKGRSRRRRREWNQIEANASTRNGEDNNNGGPAVIPG